jgi:hypothetical protein
MKSSQATIDASIKANKMAKAAKLARSGICVSGRTQFAWRRELQGVCVELVELSAVRETEDGFQYVDTQRAPEGLLDYYRALRQLGYAKGWL